MKNVLNYYYNLNPENIHQKEKKVQFSINNDYYIFLPFNRNINDLESIYEVSVELFAKMIYSHQFVLNINNQLVTSVENQPYVLLKVYYNQDTRVRLEELIIFSQNSSVRNFQKIDRSNWGSLWSSKIDYFEYQVSQFGKKYPIIRDSFSYFVGLAETAIVFFNNLPKDGYKSVSHDRIGYNSSYFDMYNPLEFVIDYRVRDASEYLKSSFFESSEDVLLLAMNYIKDSELTPNESLLLFSRMMFPSFYFDKYEQVIHNEINESELLSIIDQINHYERFLKDFYNYLKTFIQFPNIEWLHQRH